MNTNLGILGRKIGMTQIFNEDGHVVPVTVVEAGPCPITQVRTTDRDGYEAIQIGFGQRRPIRTTRPMAGHFAASNLEADRFPHHVREIRLEDASGYNAGDDLVVADVFNPGDKVDVSGTSKGRGYAGVMKRHNFRGFIRTHGTHEFFRHGGSIGTRLTPGHVGKGKRMSGQMGNERVTVQNLTIAKMDAERNLLFIKGGIPGPNNGLVLVRRAAKTRN